MLIQLATVVVLVAAFGRKAGRSGVSPGVKVFEDAPGVGFCSFIKAGRQFFDAETGRELSRSEAEARAQREDCGKQLFP